MFDPQLLEKTPTKLRISKISYCNTFPRAETKLPRSVGVYDTPCLYLIGYICTVSSGKF